MADISKNSELQFLLNGKVVNAPLSWQDITITAEYDGDDIQPSLTTDSFVFNLDARKSISEWIEAGMNGGVGIFEAMPFDLKVYNNSSSKVFSSLLDFTNGYKEFPDDCETAVSLIDRNGLEGFFNKLNGTTFGYLESIGVFTEADYKDVEYVVEKKFNLIEIILASITLYLMVKELAESIERTADAIAEVAGLSLFVGAGSTALGAALLAILKAVINVVYTAILYLAMIEMSKTLFESLVSPKRTHKALYLRTAITKIANYYGYQLEAPLLEYNNVVYLPSNPNQDEKTALGFISVTKGTQKGIPNVLDYGYLTEDFFKLAKDLPNANMAIIGNTIHLRPKNDPFWIQQAQWIPRDILINTKEYNTGELNSTILNSFSVDGGDEWTIDNYKGTAIEIKTSPISVIDEKAVLLKGFDETQFNVALGNRKDELNAIENLLKGVGSFIDNVTGIFGGGTNFKEVIEDRIGVLKQTSNWHTIPKVLWIDSDGKLPSNHRDLLNAEVLWDNYHSDKSFVQNNYRGQKELYNNVTIPFGFEDFLKLLGNSHFKINGIESKITKFVWTVGEDEAVIDYYSRIPYTRNLQETKIIPE